MVPHPGQINSSQVQLDHQGSKLKDCWSCRIIGGGFHLAIAAFVGSHYRQMPGTMSKAFILTFSTGLACLGIARVAHLPPFGPFPGASNDQ